MNRITPIALAIGAFLSTNSFAQTVRGSITDVKGMPIANATVMVEGTPTKVKTDGSGKFFIESSTERVVELHVSADGFTHLTRIVEEPDSAVLLQLTLKRSAIEVIDIVASPLHLSNMESASPVSVLGGEELRRQQSNTLGDTLEKTVGVQSSFHGKVASTPIIRGLSGPRVLIAQNGLDVGDVSRVGPDHAVASEVSTAQQIEVLRGPATLLYGSGAIGGVVNVVDVRVPTDNETRGEWLVESASVDNSKLGSFNVTTGLDSLAVYASGYWRESDSYYIPVPAKVGTRSIDNSFKVENSQEKSDGFTIGTSYLFDQGHVGIAVEKFNRIYGIPGHSHAHSDEDGHDHSHEGEDGVVAELNQTRVQLLSEIHFSNSLFSELSTRAAFTDYEHAEVEHGAVETLFQNDSKELRVDLKHNDWTNWNGAVSFHYKDSETSAQGSEAFTPPSKAAMLALALMEERRFDDVLVQLGARFEQVKLSATSISLPEVDLHSQSEKEQTDIVVDQVVSFDDEYKFKPTSLSAGLVWDFIQGYNVGLSLSRSQRAPSASEIFSFGPHIGAGSYEVGALFSLIGQGEQQYFGLSEKNIDVETSNNIDLTFRKTDGDIGFILNAFYNQVDNFYYQSATGLFAPSGHEHNQSNAQENSDDLPVYLFKSDDVILHGFEAQVAWQATDSFKTTLFTDYVRARLKDQGNLPRTSPLRFGAKLNYQQNSWSANLDIIRYQKQKDLAPMETETDGYTMVDTDVLYDLPYFNQSMSMFFKVRNLTNTEARVHTSFLKDVAPRQGRSFSIGLRGSF